MREFFRLVWDDEYVDDGSLARCIAEVRAALGDDAREPRYVETVPRRGYRLIAAVGDGRVSAPPALPGEPPAEAPIAGPEVRPPRAWPALGALVALAGVGLLAGWWHLARRATACSPG